MIRLRLDTSKGISVIRAALERKMLASGRKIARTWGSVAEASGAPKNYVAGARAADVAITESTDEGEAIRVAVTITHATPGSKYVDTGHEAYRLPEVYHWPTPKTKISKSGRMYLTIPLPIATASIPRTILRRARALHKVGKRVRNSTVPAQFKGLFRGAKSWGVFRTMRPDSPGWQIPAKEGLRIVDKVRKLIADAPADVIGGEA